jgi:hypothetical protein
MVSPDMPPVMLFPPSTSTSPVMGEGGNVVVGVLGLEVSVVSVGGGGKSSVGIPAVGGLTGVGGTLAVAGAEVLVGTVVGRLPAGAISQADRATAMKMTRTPNVYLMDRDMFRSLYDDLIVSP